MRHSAPALLVAALICVFAVNANADDDPPTPEAVPAPAERPKIAVYVTGGIPENERTALGTRMLASLVKSGRYKGIERSNMFLAEVEKEQAKQRSGAVDDNQIRELGKMFGVAFVCISAVTPAFGSYQVSARIVDVQTAEVAFIGVSYSMLQSVNDLEKVSDEVVTSLFSAESGGEEHAAEAPKAKGQAQEPQAAANVATVAPATADAKVRRGGRRAANVKQPVTAQGPKDTNPPPGSAQPHPPTTTQSSQGQRETAKAGFGQVAENTVFVDVAPIALGFALSGAKQILTDIVYDRAKISGFSLGIGVQYEHRLRDKLGLVGRLDFQNMNLGVTLRYYDGELEQTDVALYHISFEAHARVYPFGGAFFLNGMAGFGSISGGLDHKYEYPDGYYYDYDYYGSRDKFTVALSRGYLKLGPSLGYRKTFGKNGEFAYETSFGYRFSFFGNSIAKQIAQGFEDNDEGYYDSALFNVLEDFVFAGGPRLVVAFGYNF